MAASISRVQQRVLNALGMAKRNFKQKRLDLEHRIGLATTRLAAAQAKAVKLQSRLDELQAEHKLLLVSRKAILGAHNSRNRRLYAVLDVVNERLSEPDATDGLRTGVLYEAVRLEGFKLVDVTFRGYLRKYQDKGALRKESGRWYAVGSNTTAPLSSWEVADD